MGRFHILLERECEFLDVQAGRLGEINLHFFNKRPDGAPSSDLIVLTLPEARQLLDGLQGLLQPMDED